MAKHRMHSSDECEADGFCPVVPYDIKWLEYLIVSPLGRGAHRSEEMFYTGVVYLSHISCSWVRYRVHGTDRYI